MTVTEKYWHHQYIDITSFKSKISTSYRFKKRYIDPTL